MEIYSDDIEVITDAEIVEPRYNFDLSEEDIIDINQSIEQGRDDLFEDMDFDVIDMEEDADNAPSSTASIRAVNYLMYNESTYVINELDRFCERVTEETNNFSKERKLSSDLFNFVNTHRNVKSAIYLYRVHGELTSDIVDNIVAKDLSIYMTTQMGRKFTNEDAYNQTRETIRRAVEHLVSITLLRFKGSDIEAKMNRLDALFAYSVDEIMELGNGQEGLQVGSIEDLENEKLLQYINTWVISRINNKSGAEAFIPFKNIDLYMTWSKIYGEVINAGKLNSLLETALRERVKELPAETLDILNLRLIVTSKLYNSSNMYSTTHYRGNDGRGLGVVEYYDYIRKMKTLYPKKDLVIIDEVEEELSGGKDTTKGIYAKCVCGKIHRVDGLLSEVRLLKSSDSEYKELRNFKPTTDSYNRARLKSTLPLDVDKSLSVDSSKGQKLPYGDDFIVKGRIYQSFVLCDNPECQRILALSEYDYRIMFEHMKNFLIEQAQVINDDVREGIGIPSIRKILEINDYDMVDSNTLSINIIVKEDNQQEKKIELESSFDDISLECAEFLERLKSLEPVYKEKRNEIGKVDNDPYLTKLYHNFLLWFLKSNYNVDLEPDNLISIILRYYFGSKIDTLEQKVKVMNEDIENIQKMECEYKKFLEGMHVFKKNLTDFEDPIFEKVETSKEISNYTTELISIIERCIIFALMESNDVKIDVVRDEVAKALKTKVMNSEDTIMNDENYEELLNIVNSIITEDILKFTSNGSLDADAFEQKYSEKVSNEVVTIYNRNYFIEANILEKLSKGISSNFEIVPDKIPGGSTLSRKVTRATKEYIIRKIGIETINSDNSCDIAEVIERERKKFYEFAEQIQLEKLIEIHKDSNPGNNIGLNLQMYVFYNLSKVEIDTPVEELVNNDKLLNNVKNSLYYRNKYLSSEKVLSASISELIDMCITTEIQYQCWCKVQEYILNNSYAKGVEILQTKAVAEFEDIFKAIVEQETMLLERDRCFSKWFAKVSTRTNIKASDLSYQKVCPEFAKNKNIKSYCSRVGEAPQFKLSLDFFELTGAVQETIWQLIKLMDSNFRNSIIDNMYSDIGNDELTELVLQIEKSNEDSNIKYSFNDIFRSIFNLPAIEIDTDLEHEIKEGLKEERYDLDLANRFADYLEMNKGRMDFLRFCGIVKSDGPSRVESNVDLLLNKVQKISVSGSALPYKVQNSIYGYMSK